MTLHLDDHIEELRRLEKKYQAEAIKQKLANNLANANVCTRRLQSFQEVRQMLEEMERCKIPMAEMMELLSMRKTQYRKSKQTNLFKNTGS